MIFRTIFFDFSILSYNKTTRVNIRSVQIILIKSKLIILNYLSQSQILSWGIVCLITLYCINARELFVKHCFWHARNTKHPVANHGTNLGFALQATDNPKKRVQRHWLPWGAVKQPYMLHILATSLIRIQVNIQKRRKMKSIER